VLLGLALTYNDTIRESGRNTPAESLQAKIHEAEKGSGTSTIALYIRHLNLFIKVRRSWSDVAAEGPACSEKLAPEPEPTVIDPDASQVISF